MTEIEGFIIAGPAPSGGLLADWDGDVHGTRKEGDAELKNCHREGYDDYRLYELRPVSPESVERGLSEAERAVNRVRLLVMTSRKTVPTVEVAQAVAIRKQEASR